MVVVTVVPCESSMISLYTTETDETYTWQWLWQDSGPSSCPPMRDASFLENVGKCKAILFPSGIMIIIGRKSSSLGRKNYMRGPILRWNFKVGWNREKRIRRLPVYGKIRAASKNLFFNHTMLTSRGAVHRLSKRSFNAAKRTNAFFSTAALLPRASLPSSTSSKPSHKSLAPSSVPGS